MDVVPIVPVEIEISPAPPPAEVAALIDDATQRIDVFFDQRGKDRPTGFYPSDFELVFRGLRAVRELSPEGRRMCEWGCGFGVASGMATTLGYTACGIEIDRVLVEEARQLLATHDLQVEVLEGSFIPEDYARHERLSDLETMTVMTGADVYGDGDSDIEDYDLIFAYPWPDEEGQFCDLFDQYGNYGALLMTYSMIEGMRLYRKVGSS